jgi:hypothetical protein
VWATLQDQLSVKMCNSKGISSGATHPVLPRPFWSARIIGPKNRLQRCYLNGPSVRVRPILSPNLRQGCIGPDKYGRPAGTSRSATCPGPSPPHSLSYLPKEGCRPPGRPNLTGARRLPLLLLHWATTALPSFSSLIRCKRIYNF